MSSSEFGRQVTYWWCLLLARGVLSSCVALAQANLTGRGMKGGVGMAPKATRRGPNEPD